MNESTHTEQKRRKRWWQRRWFHVVAGLAVLAVIVFLGTVEYFVRNAAPILRKRVIETLSERFHAPVQLDTLDISLAKGLQVSGSGLRIPYGGPANPAGSGPTPALITVNHFEFHSTLKSLLHGHMQVALIAVDGVTIDLPVGEERKQIFGPMQHNAPAGPEHSSTKPKLALLVDRIVCKNVKLILEVNDPAKQPHEFDISHLVLDKTSGSLSYNYHAQLTNPTPRGDIDAQGHLGPWNTDVPRETPITGDYTFSHADLDTIKGLGGILSSTGHFEGVIDHITIDGTTDTPDFSLDISDHPLHLTTKFHAYVDGTSGDTTLDSVDAMLEQTHILCRGKVQNLKHQGHDITLDAMIPRGRMRDVLALGMKAPKPIMNGVLAMKSKIHIPPGKVRVAAKLELAGQLQIHEITLTNPAVQDRLDGLSMRAQGKPKDVKEASSDKTVEATSSLSTNFVLAHGQIVFSSVKYELPGAHIQLDGIYDMNGDAFDFKGHVRTDATASQMVSGWKSVLLKPVDPFLKKHGAGVELPISISGAKNDVHFGLALHHGDDTTKDIREEMKDKRATGELPPTKKSKQDVKANAGADGAAADGSGDIKKK